MKLILASQSPRRLELLKTLGLDVVVVKPQMSEIETGFGAEELSLRNAQGKARAVHKDCGLIEGELILGADTVVSLEGRIFGKPKDADDALFILRTLSGHRHEVITSYCLIAAGDKEISRSVLSSVIFRALTTKEILAYLKTNEWCDKAGAYGVQGLGCALIRQVEGSITNVVGLPIEEFLSDAHRLIHR